jgi:hypothetical protein
MSVPEEASSAASDDDDDPDDDVFAVAEITFVGRSPTTETNSRFCVIS